ARRFAPQTEYRLEYSPRIRVRLNARFAEAPVGYREPLVTIGHSHYNYFLFAERSPDGVTLVSKTYESELKAPVPRALMAPLQLDMAYAPDRGDMTIAVAGGESTVHHVGPLVAAPATVAIGSNLADMGLTSRRFLGPIEVVEKTVAR